MTQAGQDQTVNRLLEHSDRTQQVGWAAKNDPDLVSGPELGFVINTDFAHKIIFSLFYDYFNLNCYRKLGYPNFPCCWQH